MIKVRIKKLPQARTGYQVQGALVNDVPAMGGMDYNAYIGKEKLKESKYITAVPREEANLEAEGGETVYGDINGDGIPEHKIIKGPRHAQGGVPLSLPEDTFIFSDTRGMLIKDPEILTMFGKGGTNKSYTPAELAKQYDVQKYRKILEDPETDVIERKTAELMIKKFVIKLGCLALAQESMKGFPQGIPAVAKPCMEAKGLSEQDVLPNQEISALNDQLKKQMEQKEGNPEDMVQEATDMNDGNPVAQPQEQEMEQMQQPSPEEMMRYGGYRRLRRAQEGMQQPSEEEMAMMQQQGGGDEMGQIMQEVQAALERGAEPSEVVMSLLQNGVPPEGIVQIFIQLGASQEQAVGLIQEVMQQGQAGGQEQMMAQEPMQGQPMSEEEAMMMQQQQMQQQAPPMAMYGMSMGGYDMPFFDIPQAEYGMAMGSGQSQNYQGRPKRIPGSGPMFNLPKAPNGIEVKEDPNWTPEEKEKALRRAYVQSGYGKEKIYIVKADGTRVPQKVTAKGFENYGGSELNLFNGNKVAAATYEAMENSFKDETVRKKFAQSTRDALKDQASYKRKKGPDAKTWAAATGHSPDELTDDEIIDNYLLHQKRNISTMTYGPKIYGDGTDILGKKGNLPFGSYLYTDLNGKLRNFNSTGDGKGDKKGFKDVVKSIPAYANLTDAEIQKMYDKIKAAGYTSLHKISQDQAKVANIPALEVPDPGDPNRKYEHWRGTKLFQGSFIGANKLMREVSDYNNTSYDEDMRVALLPFTTSTSGYKPFGLEQGFDDEMAISGSPRISPADADDTNTTRAQIQGISSYAFEDETNPPDNKCQCDNPNAPNYGITFNKETNKCEGTCPKPKDCPCKKSDGTEINMTPDKNGNCPPCEEEEDINVPGPPAEWWLQDTIKTTGAFGDLMGLKKYMPWAPGVELSTPRPTFLDPTRELAANAEQANIQTQGMAQFAGPQAFSARSSSIQGQAAKNAADILSKYNNANVNIANQFEMKGTDIRNQESMLKQATAQRLYDQNTVANQQFDNAKLAMRNQLRNYYTNAITNRWKTDALNQMYPNYAVSPGVGGRMYYQPTQKSTNPGGSTSGTMTQQEALDWCKQNDPNTSTSQCIQRMMSTNKFATSGNTGANPNAVNTMYSGVKNGGSVYEDGGYVHINSWLPFIL